MDAHGLEIQRGGTVVINVKNCANFFFVKILKKLIEITQNSIFVLKFYFFKAQKCIFISTFFLPPKKDPYFT
jgi:hypothetical protein